MNGPPFEPAAWKLRTFTEARSDARSSASTACSGVAKRWFGGWPWRRQKRCTGGSPGAKLTNWATFATSASWSSTSSLSNTRRASDVGMRLPGLGRPAHLAERLPQRLGRQDSVGVERSDGAPDQPLALLDRERLEVLPQEPRTHAHSGKELLCTAARVLPAVGEHHRASVALDHPGPEGVVVPLPPAWHVVDGCGVDNVPPAALAHRAHDRLDVLTVAPHDVAVVLLPVAVLGRGQRRASSTAPLHEAPAGGDRGAYVHRPAVLDDAVEHLEYQARDRSLCVQSRRLIPRIRS